MKRTTKSFHVTLQGHYSLIRAMQGLIDSGAIVITNEDGRQRFGLSPEAELYVKLTRSRSAGSIVEDDDERRRHTPEMAMEASA